MNRQTDWSSALSYISASLLAISNGFIDNLDQHAAAIGAACQVVGVSVVVLTYLWNRSCQLKRLKYYEEHFKELIDRDGIPLDNGE
jgi:hypothetical protein